MEKELQLRILGLITIATYIIPLLLLFVLKRSKRIQSYELSEIQERKSPVIAMVLIFYTLSNLLGNFGQLSILAMLFMGCAISSAICYMAFAKQLKASIHMIGAATASSFILIYSVLYQTNLLTAFAISVAIAGLIGQARLHLKAHSPKEIFWGTVIGVFGQLVAFGNALLHEL